MRPLMVTLMGGRSNSLGTVGISNVNASDSATYPSSAACVYSLNSDGSSVEGNTAGTWLVGSSNGAAYEAKVTVTSGSLSSGTTGSWIALSSNRTWRVSRSSIGTSTCTFTVQIGLAGTSTALDSATVTLSATVDPAEGGGGGGGA